MAALTYNIHTEIVIPASPEKVWAVFSDFTKWREWNDFMVFDESPTKVGSSCNVLFRLDEGCMATSRHHPEVRAATLRPMYVYPLPLYRASLSVCCFDGLAVVGLRKAETGSRQLADVRKK
jgi:hypothetical protein